MALTAVITTDDGVEHTNAYAEVYPLTIQTVTGDMSLSMQLHCWHDLAAKAAGRGELAGYPQPISLNGSAAEVAIVTGMAPLADIEWTEDPIVNAGLAQAAIIAAMEDVVIGQFPMFSRVEP